MFSNISVDVSKPRIFSIFYVGNPKQDNTILRNPKQVRFSILGLASW